VRAPRCEIEGPVTATVTSANQYIGLFSILCFAALAVCCRVLVLVAGVVERFHMDYRNVNQLDERDDWESEA
jgi:hypothetical protein